MNFHFTWPLVNSISQIKIGMSSSILPFFFPFFEYQTLFRSDGKMNYRILLVPTLGMSSNGRRKEE